MNASEYQKRAHALAIYPQERAVEYVALGLASEAGEVAGKIKKAIRDGKNWTGEERHEHLRAIVAELGDVAWYLAELCTLYDVDMSGVLKGNLLKLESRQARGTIAGSGDNR